jgi:hypothetical protein
MIYWTKEGKEHVLNQALSGITHRYTFEQRFYTSHQLLKPYELRNLYIRESNLGGCLAKIQLTYDRYLELNVYLGQQPKGVLLASIRGEHIND